MKTRWLPAYLALGTVWGCSFLFIKNGLEFLTPFGVAFGRCSLGALTLILIAKLRKIKLSRDPKIWGHLLVISLLLNVFPGFLYAFAETKVTSILAGIINAVTPLMTVLATLLIHRADKPKAIQLYGLAVGFIGVMIVMGVWNGLGTNPILYVGALFLGVTCYGFSFPYSRRFVLPYKLEPIQMATVQLICAATVLLPGYIFNGVTKYELKPAPFLSMLCLGAEARELRRLSRSWPAASPTVSPEPVFHSPTAHVAWRPTRPGSLEAPGRSPGHPRAHPA